jgi:hypothetical protein
MESNIEYAKNAAMLSGVLASGTSAIITRDGFGDVVIDAGEVKSHSFGLNHIIYQRIVDDKDTVKDITALLFLLPDTIKNGSVSREIPFARNPNHKGRIEFEKDGIVAIVSRQRKQGDSEKWLLTGYTSTVKKEEATGAIQKVNSKYGYTPEFLGLEKQVGAVGASLCTSIPQTLEMSSGS